LTRISEAACRFSASESGDSGKLPPGMGRAEVGVAASVRSALSNSMISLSMRVNMGLSSHCSGMALAVIDLEKTIQIPVPWHSISLDDAPLLCKYNKGARLLGNFAENALLLAHFE
jgi:hypothetical protein